MLAGYRFPREVIAVAVRWYQRYGLSYRDVQELLAGARIRPLALTWTFSGPLVVAEAAEDRAALDRLMEKPARFRRTRPVGRK